MAPRFEVVTFDCYGTLIDWETGIWKAFQAAARRDGVSLEREALLAAYARLEPLVEAGPYRSYRAVLDETARRVAAELGWRPGEGGGFLAESLPRWLPFPDTNAALARLAAAGCRLGILSNVDDDLLAATCQHFAAPFEFVVAAAQVRSYKPGRAHFLAARERIGTARWLHAAASHFHDVVPARALAIPVAWVNRKREPLPEGDPPLREVRNLAELADWLCGA